MNKNADYVSAYRSMYMIRSAEEEVARIYPSDKIKSPVHLSIGQEIISVAVCQALNPKDVVFGTYRSHALYLAKTGDLEGFFAELYGKVTGCCKGRGGSMHLALPSKGMMGTSAIVATTIPLAVGYAYAEKLRGADTTVVVFLGDGATEEGVFHESLNFAALKSLPVIFVCENNQYAIHTHQAARQSRADICSIARSHGVGSVRLANSGFDEIYKTVDEIKVEISNGCIRPHLIECLTSRWREHVGPGEDFSLGFRDEDEIKVWRENDQMLYLCGRLPVELSSKIRAEVDSAVASAIKFAEDSLYPHVSSLFDSKLSDKCSVYAPNQEQVRTELGRDIKYSEAIHEALDLEMCKDSDVVLYGLDVDDPKGILGTTLGLNTKYGVGRVFGTPLSEDSMTGVGIGMALAGLRPIHVHIRMDFLMLAMNQLVNIASKYRYMFGDQFTVPLVIRAIVGRSWGQGAQHSQAFHSFFMHVPGVKVVAPSNPFDAKGCMIAAIRDPEPVIYMEHRLLHSQIGPVPKNSYEVKPGKARVVVDGSDITLVGISYMALECQRAAVYLQDKRISAEVIDPIWLSPLDIDTIIKSVEKTKKVIIVDNGWTTCGASSEIAALISEQLSIDETVIIRRMGFAQTTCPTAPTLEAAFYVNAIDIATYCYRVLSDSSEVWVPDSKPELSTFTFKGPF